MIAEGDIWWADLGDPVGSAPSYRLPVLVVQCDAFNNRCTATVLCVSLTGTSRLADRPGNTLLKAAQTDLDCDSVASGSLTLALDRDQ